MQYRRIQQLSWFLPPNPEFAQDMQYDYLMRSLPQLERMAETLKYYSDVRFGWYFAHTIHELGITPPSFLDGRDTAVIRAYRWLEGSDDPAVETAVAIATFEHMWPVKSTIDSFLISEQVLTEQGKYEKLEEISREVAMPFNVIRMYETLFFNILDRMRDSKYLRSVVYPQTRMVELSERYAENEDLKALLLRTAYNHGQSQLDHFLGGRSMFGSMSDAHEFAEKLEASLMAQGMLLAQNGYANTDRAPAVRHARQLIAAAKAGGADTGGETQLQSMGDVLMSELRRIENHQFHDIPEAEIINVS